MSIHEIESQALKLPPEQRAALAQHLIASLDEANETALLSEPALAADWNRDEEDEAWAHLQ